MKKVLYIATVAKKHICQFHIPYLKWFHEQGYEVDVAARDDFEEGDEHKIPYCDRFYDIPFSRSPVSSDNVKSYRQLKKIIKNNEYELIHCHTPIAAAIGRMAARKSKASVLYTTHGFHFYKGCPKSGKLYHMAEKYLVRYTDGLITINAEDYEAAKEMCKGKKCDVYYIHGVGVDIEKYAKCEKSAAEIKKEFGIPEKSFVLLSVSEINANKNLKTTIEAFAKAKQEDMYYLICGSGDQKEALQELVRNLEIEDKVIFAGYRYDIYEVVHIADIFLFPSLREGLGLAPIEAMAAGVPIIASDIRGIREYAVNRKNSILLRPEDADGFAEAIKELYTDRELKKSLGEAAAGSVEPFSLENSIKAMADIYGRYIESKK